MCSTVLCTTPRTNVRFIDIKFAFDSPVQLIGIENLNCFTIYHKCVNFSVLHEKNGTNTATPEELLINYETQEEFNDRVHQEI